MNQSSQNGPDYNRLKRLKCHNLLGQFNYDLNLDRDISILVGPNGYGKTTILHYLSILGDRKPKAIARLQNIISGKLEIENSGGTFTIDSKGYESATQSEHILPPTLMVEELRTLLISSNGDPDLVFVADAVAQIAEKLRDLIQTTQRTVAGIDAELSSSFFNRLREIDWTINKEQFEKRYANLERIGKDLAHFRLATNALGDSPEFREEDSKAILIYLGDTETKLNIYRPLLDKLKLFTKILNERRFLNKRIEASPEHGFQVFSNENEPLELQSLSSGEKHQIIVLYKLIFEAEPGSLALIDEPELSLHVVWQKAFLEDLAEIVEMNKLQVIIATHSPQIINGNWDMCIDLVRQIDE